MKLDLIRNRAREIRNMEFIAEALRARRFDEVNTLAMGFLLIDFARDFAKVVENA